MKTRRKSNALLVELLIVILFFMLAATVVLQVFYAAHAQSEHAATVTEALNTAQNIADELYLAADADVLLTEKGFERLSEAGEWRKDCGTYSLEAASAIEETDTGLMRVQSVRVLADEEELFTLSCSRYEEGSL